MNTVPRQTRGSAVPRTTPAAGKKKLAAADKENAIAKPTRAEFDVFAEKLEQKYNIDGSNTLDIIYARQENDAANATIAAQEAKIEAMTRELEAMKASAKDDTENAEMTDVANADALAGPAGTAVDEISAALAREQAKNARLERLLAAAEHADAATNSVSTVPAPGSVVRPTGTAGKDFNIQHAMGLGKTVKDGDKFRAVQRNVRDLVIQAGVNWEKAWADIAADVKAKLFAAARERHPILARYHNDWATAEIAKQYMKNKRNNAYKNGWLEPPAKYSHLKANAAKRNPSAPRGRQNKLANAKIAKKRATAKKTSASKTAAVKKGKAKAKVVVSDDEDEEMSDVESESAMEEDD